MMCRGPRPYLKVCEKNEQATSGNECLRTSQGELSGCGVGDKGFQDENVEQIVEQTWNRTR